MIKNMPVIAIDLTLENPENPEATNRIIFGHDTDEINPVINVQRDVCHTLTVKLRKNFGSKSKVHAPMFLKGKDENWFLILGDVQNQELWALKRVPSINNQPRFYQLQFHTPNNCGKVN